MFEQPVLGWKPSRTGVTVLRVQTVEILFDGIKWEWIDDGRMLDKVVHDI
jgi:hypothetical protein